MTRRRLVAAGAVIAVAVACGEGGGSPREAPLRAAPGPTAAAEETAPRAQSAPTAADPVSPVTTETERSAAEAVPPAAETVRPAAEAVPPAAEAVPPTPPAATAPAEATRASPGAPSGPAAADPHARPAWLGTRVLDVGADGFGEVLATPPELVDRRLRPPPSVLPEPPVDDTYRAEIAAVPPAVLERSTWSPDCPVGAEDLAYVTVTFWGFDGRPHAGELLVHADWAEGIAGVFRRLYEARFPLEEVRIVEDHELDRPPTGDGNNTTAFVCRPVVGASRWSQHAHGLAVDVNPFHNPYIKDDLVVPELASAYLDRDHRRPGMVRAGGPVVSAFDELGWGWGGRWRRPLDWMHFSATGR